MIGSGVEFEKLVQLVEQSINPDAKVEHDVQMPIANSPTGATTQCDVVITTGTPPRETVTIVEVQDRGSKPAANDFRGWRQKLRDVNAQHLICVSRTGFTESEIEKASQSGNRIRLVTLSELDADQIPLDFLEMYFVYDGFNITQRGNPRITASGTDIKRLGLKEAVSDLKNTIGLNEKRFSTDKKNRVSLNDLCRSNSGRLGETAIGRDELRFERDKNHIYMVVEDNLVRIELFFEYEWSREFSKVPASVLSYDQDEHGALAWVLKAGYDSEDGYIGFKMPVTEIADGGGYEVKGLRIEDPEEQLIEFTLYRSRGHATPPYNQAL